MLYHQDWLPRGTPDPAVAETAIANEAVYVAQDRDAKQLAKKDRSKGTRLERMQLLHLRCEGPMAAKRVEYLMDLIEYEWRESQKKKASRFFVEIGKHYFKTFR